MAWTSSSPSITFVLLEPQSAIRHGEISIGRCWRVDCTTGGISSPRSSLLLPPRCMMSSLRVDGCEVNLDSVSLLRKSTIVASFVLTVLVERFRLAGTCIAGDHWAVSGKVHTLQHSVSEPPNRRRENMDALGLIPSHLDFRMRQKLQAISILMRFVALPDAFRTED